MIYLRSFLANTLFYSTLAVGCICTSIIGLFSKKATIPVWNHFFMPLCCWYMKAIAGLSIEIRGQENMRQEGVIYASKHQSAIETYCLTSYITQATFILKKELTYIPIFGWAQHMYGMIAVDRSAGGATLKKLLKTAKGKLKEGRPIIIFPEGTRTKPGLTTEYKPGLVFLYQNTQVPVIPVALNTGMFWAKKSFKRYPGKIIIEFMEPMSMGLDKKEFMGQLQARIEAKCAELNAETIKNYPYTAQALTQKAKGK